MDEIDIWRTASILIKEYPDDADLVAARRADALLERGDPEGCRTWLRITAAVEALRRHKPQDGEALN